MLNEAQKTVTGRFIGVTDEAFQAAAGRHTATTNARDLKMPGDTLDLAASPYRYHGTLQKMDAMDDDEGDAADMSVEGHTDAALRHLAEMDDPDENRGDHLVRAARHLMAACGKHFGDTATQSSRHAGFVMNSPIGVRFAPLQKS